MEYHFAVKLLLPVAFAFMAMFTVTVQAQSSNSTPIRVLNGILYLLHARRPPVRGVATLQQCS